MQIASPCAWLGSCCQPSHQPQLATSGAIPPIHTAPAAPYPCASNNYRAWLITYAAASSGAAAVQWPAADACIARLVPPGLHQRANGAAEASEAVAEVCAPLAGGLAVWALGGVRAILWMDTCTCCMAIGIVLLLRPALRQPDKAVAARKQQQQHGLATYMAIVRLPQVAQPLWFAFTTSLFESAAGALLLPVHKPWSLHPHTLF